MNSDIPSISPSPSGVWRLTKAIVGEALELPGVARGAFVEHACEGDASLRSEVVALLRSYDTAGDSLSEAGVPAETLADALAGPSLTEGMMIGRYRIAATLGAGGMGTVFEAIDTALERRVAIKLLSMGFSSNAARRRFEGEAAALARLDHANVARVYEVGVQQSPGQPISVPYFAMELVTAARTLDQFVRESKPDLRAMLAMFATICDAVHHGHTKGVLHRDLKPANILVDGLGVPKVIDFGVSRLADASNSRSTTQVGDVVGTPAYLPPEAFEQGMHALDTRADVYALGITFYEVLNGAGPFDAKNLTPATARAIVCGKPPRMLGSLRNDCRGDVETVVAKAMAGDASERYQSAEQFAADIRRMLAYEPIVARRTSLARQARLFARRNTLVVAVAGLVGLALMIGAGGLALGIAKARESERKALQEATRARQVSDFLTRMVSSANPFPALTAQENMQGGDASAWPSPARPGVAPTAGDLLEGASQQIEAAFPNDLALQADVALLLAETSWKLADPRAYAMAIRAYQSIVDAYGTDDRRTISITSMLYSNESLNSTITRLPEMMRCLSILNQRNDAAEDALALSIWSTLVATYETQEQRPEALKIIANRRETLSQRRIIPVLEETYLDIAELRASVGYQDPATAITRLPELLARAQSATPGKQQLLSALIAEESNYKRAMGDLFGALQTIGEGTTVAMRIRGGQDPLAYEWLSHMWFVAMQLNDLDTAEFAAREQVRGARAMLGQHTNYTTKAAGRLARVLLAKEVKLEEAEAEARYAVEGMPELIAKADGWGVYHELLEAWAIRLRGNPARALDIIRQRQHEASRIGMTEIVSWLEIIRQTEIAQCKMDIAAARGGLSPAEASEVLWLLNDASCHADVLIRSSGNWPSTRLVDEARQRFERLPDSSKLSDANRTH